SDRLLEDRRIGGHAFDAVIVDQLFQIALGDEAAGQEIQPDRLAVLFKRFDGIHDAVHPFSAELFFRFQHSAVRRILSTRPAGKLMAGIYVIPVTITLFIADRSGKSAVQPRFSRGFVMMPPPASIAVTA